METVYLKELRDKAQAYDDKLLATDPRFNRSVTIIHRDGSFFYFSHAFMMQANSDTEWIIVFTEHHGVHISHVDDLRAFHASDRCSPEELESLVP